LRFVTFGPRATTIALRHGTTVTYSRSGRRLLERDRHGHELVRLSWGATGALAGAKVRVPDGSWLTIEPRAATGPWGLSDRLWHRGAALTIFEAVDYARIAAIPTLAEPARLPVGGGIAVLNLLAGLASDQGGRRLAYRGPYPTESLFLALLESFRHDGRDGDPLRAFMNGALTWEPAPHEGLVATDGVWLQLRDGVEKVVWENRAYHREACQGISRHAARRVRDCEGSVLCSLWSLGACLEDHLRMDVTGDAVEILPAGPIDAGVVPCPPAILAGVAAVVAGRSTPVLGPFIMEAAAGLALEWGPIPRDVIALDGTRLRVTSRLLSAARSRLGAAASPDEQMQVALLLVAEMAHLAGDPLRAQAQARLAALPVAEQAAILEAARGVANATAARAIAVAVRTLLRWAPLRDGVQDQLDVEGDEDADRER
jgi:hypothetical protein